MDEGTPGLERSKADEEPDEAVQRLEARAESVRENLGELVDELDRRRHRVMKPLAIGSLALGGLVVGGVLLWRRHRRPSRLRAMGLALGRRSERPERVAEPASSYGKKVLVAAAVAVAVRRLAARVVSLPGA